MEMCGRIMHFFFFGYSFELDSLDEHSSDANGKTWLFNLVNQHNSIDFPFGL